MVIGIAVIVAMLSIGEGMQASMTEQLDRLGGDKLTVMPSGIMESIGGGPPQEFLPFTDSDLREIEKIPGVEKTAPFFMKTGQVEFHSEEENNVYILGATEEGLETFQDFYSLKKGRYVKEGEGNAINVGFRVAEEMFEREATVGDSLKINGKNFRIVGIFEEIGSQDDDSTIYMDMEAAQNLFDSKNEYMMIYVIAENEKVVDVVAQRLEDRLEKLRGGKDFDIMTTKEMAEQVNQILATVEFVIAGIASVSLIVGAVIIMNTMLVNVLERTQEIGVMKATGARSSNILKMFVVESGLVGIIGGAIGLLVGAIIAKGVEAVGKVYVGSMFFTRISWQLALGVLIFSLVLGSISGAYPAYRAARLDPVEALRYE